MKRLKQHAGIKEWYGDDILSLQEEPMKVLDQLLAQFGGYVVAGCEVTASGAKYKVAQGLVMLSGTNPDGESVSLVVPYAGTTTAQALPLYLSLGYDIIEDTYGDGADKPIAYDYKALASNIVPSAPYIEVSVATTPRLKTVLRTFLQDASNRFITDTERANWNAKETTTGSQYKATAAGAAAVNSAKTYTDAINTAVRAAFASADATTLASAKSYADGLASSAAGGDLTGNYPNPIIGTSKVTSAKLATGAVVGTKIGSGAVSFDKLSAHVKSCLKTTYVVQLDVPLSSYISGLATIIMDEAYGISCAWMANILNQGYSNITIRGTDQASMTSLRITSIRNNTQGLQDHIDVLFLTGPPALLYSGIKGSLILSRLTFFADDRGGVDESKLTLGQI